METLNKVAAFLGAIKVRSPAEEALYEEVMNDLGRPLPAKTKGQQLAYQLQHSDRAKINEARANMLLEVKNEAADRQTVQRFFENVRDQALTNIELFAPQKRIKLPNEKPFIFWGPGAMKLGPWSSKHFANPEFSKVAMMLKEDDLRFCIYEQNDGVGMTSWYIVEVVPASKDWHKYEELQDIE